MRLENVKGNAKLAGLVTQLGLVGNQYNIALVCSHIYYSWLVLSKFRYSDNVLYCMSEFVLF